MGDIEKIKKIIGIIWLVILVFLWMFYPLFPGDIFFWMWLAIIWSIIGGVMGTILFMGESKKKRNNSWNYLGSYSSNSMDFLSFNPR
jgi:MFS superfamily sulfate permease-like transporter